MDLIALLSSAPPWVRSVVSVLALLWALATLVTNALRAVPEARYVAVERAWPRLGQLLRAGRKVGTDVMPFASALVGALVGRPVHEDPPQPQPRAAERGSARVGALLVVVVLALGALVACPRVTREPALAPPPHGCDAGATLCHEGAPWRCGPDGEWSQADRRCDRLGAGATAVVCCPTPSALRPGVLLHACVPSNLCDEAAQ